MVGAIPFITSRSGPSSPIPTAPPGTRHYPQRPRSKPRLPLRPPEYYKVMAAPALPTRSNENTGYISDDEPSGGDPSSTTGLLQERLQAWKHMCGYLENYIGEAAKIQKSQAKDQEKILKSVSNPLKEAHQFDSALGGVSGLFENIKSNTQAQSNLHLETQKNLTTQVLPILERLHQEIKSKAKELSSGAGKSSKAVDSARADSQKHIDALGQHAASFDSSGGKVSANNDPYVLHRGIHHRLNKQILEENNSRQDTLSVQNNFSQFESHIVTTVQAAMNSCEYPRLLKSCLWRTPQPPYLHHFLVASVSSDVSQTINS